MPELNCILTNLLVYSYLIHFNQTKDFAVRTLHLTTSDTRLSRIDHIGIAIHEQVLVYLSNEIERYYKLLYERAKCIYEQAKLGSGFDDID